MPVSDGFWRALLLAVPLGALCWLALGWALWRGVEAAARAMAGGAL